MLFDSAEPLPNPVQLQARLAVVMSLLEAQNSAVGKLRLERTRCAQSAMRPVPNAMWPTPRACPGAGRGREAAADD